MRRMSTYTHGWVDYIASAVFGALPSILGWKGTPKYLLEGAAGTAAVYSACTNYELGLVKALPMKAHLAMDAASGCMLIGSALMLDDEEPEVRSTLVRDQQNWLDSDRFRMTYCALEETSFARDTERHTKRCHLRHLSVQNRTRMVNS